MTPNPVAAASPSAAAGARRERAAAGPRESGDDAGFQQLMASPRAERGATSGPPARRPEDSPTRETAPAEAARARRNISRRADDTDTRAGEPRDASRDRRAQDDDADAAAPVPMIAWLTLPVTATPDVAPAAGADGATDAPRAPATLRLTPFAAATAAPTTTAQPAPEGLSAAAPGPVIAVPPPPAGTASPAGGPTVPPLIPAPVAAPATQAVGAVTQPAMAPAAIDAQALAQMPARDASLPPSPVLAAAVDAVDGQMPGLSADERLRSLFGGDEGTRAGGEGAFALGGDFARLTPSLAAASAPAAAAPPAFPPLPLDDAQRMTEQLGERLQWMAEDGQIDATLEVTPDDMGPVRVQLQIADGKASVAFQAAREDTVALLESALPQLRSQLADAGLTLSNASFGMQQDPSSARQGDAQPQASGERRADAETSGEAADVKKPTASAERRGERPGALDAWV